MNLHPYIFFTGNCAEAMEFYKGIFGGELKTMPHPDGSDRLMHADLSGGDISFMASDGDRKEDYPVCRITLSLSGTDGDKIKAAFEKLAEGGEVVSDLKTESWGDTFGQVTDKFGVDWMVNISAN
jgi:PhnB protein